EEADSNKGKDKEKGTTERVDDDLTKPYKEVLKSPFTRRIIEFSAPSHRIPTNLRIYDGSIDPDDHISRFVGDANQGNGRCRWANLRERFVKRFALRRRCSKDPIEVSKIVRRVNETLPNFKECWTEEMWYIHGVLEVMQLSAFMSNSKFPELLRRFADQQKQSGQETSYNKFHSSRAMQGGGPPRADGYNTYRRDHYPSYVSPRQPGRKYKNRSFQPRERFATLVPRRDANFECGQVENKQVPSEGSPGKEMVENESSTEEVMVNMTFQIKELPSDTILFSLSSPIDKVVKRQQRCVRLAAVKHGRHPETDKTKRDIIMDVAKTFDNIRKVNMKLYLRKCSFKMKEGKFLGYMVTSEGIQANPKKTKVVADMQSSKTLKEMQSLSRKLAELNHFLSRSVETSISRIEKPNHGTTNTNHTQLEGDSIRIPRCLGGGQVLADFLNEVPIGTKHLEICMLTRDENPREWTFITDGASSLKGASAGLVLIDLAGVEYTYAIQLNFASTNNEAEYEALLAGLRIAKKMKVQELKVKVDSKLVSCQMNGMPTYRTIQWNEAQNEEEMRLNLDLVQESR
nr:retrotransposon protein, putative, Ty3-gypsy subclass [Tanacetum cinerariifolium]